VDQLTGKGAASERRSEPRVNPKLPVYQFKLRDICPSGIGFIVNERSEVLEHLAVGDVLEMKYNPAKSSDAATYLKTQIRHITKITQGPFRAHFLVGMRILEAGEH
jgi:hypothetical protein